MYKKYSRKYIGMEFKTKHGYTVIVIDGGSKNNYCTINIDGYIKEISTGQLRSGNILTDRQKSYIKNRAIRKEHKLKRVVSYKNIQKIGFVGYGVYNSLDDKEPYTIWGNMIRRCYGSDPQGAIVCAEWVNFQNFADWFYNRGGYVVGYDLDKDLLSDGIIKIYSEKTCVFIPHCLNSFMTNNCYKNKNGHIGVYWSSNKNKWRSEINDCITHKTVKLGSYNNIIDASNAYKVARLKMVEKMKGLLKEKYGITDKKILDNIR